MDNLWRCCTQQSQPKVPQQTLGFCLDKICRISLLWSPAVRPEAGGSGWGAQLIVGCTSCSGGMHLSHFGCAQWLLFGHPAQQFLALWLTNEFGAEVCYGKVQPTQCYFWRKERMSHGQLPLGHSAGDAGWHICKFTCPWNLSEKSRSPAMSEFFL